jgi:hypothetical protein
MDTKFLGPGEGSNASYPGHDAIVALLSDRKAPRRMGNAIVVPTDVLLPSHVACVVVIEGGASGNEITASDAGASLACVLEAGLEITPRAAVAAGSDFRGAISCHVHGQCDAQRGRGCSCGGEAD